MKKKTAVEHYFDQLAPSWDSFPDKNPAETDLLLKKIGIREGDLVADVACGTGVISGKLHALSKAPIVGIDLSEKMIGIAKAKYASCPWVHFVVGDFLSYPEEKAFDVVVIYNAYPHFLDPEKLDLALKRVLRDKGRFAILHSLSREELHQHHEGLGAAISRDLAPAKDEACHFEKDFRILLAEEADHSFFILGEKMP